MRPINCTIKSILKFITNGKSKLKTQINFNFHHFPIDDNSYKEQ